MCKFLLLAVLFSILAGVCCYQFEKCWERDNAVIEELRGEEDGEEERG